MSCPVRSFMPAPSAAPRTPLPETDGLLPALALPRGQAGHLVAALLPALAEGRPCYCLDGGNCFDPYVLTSQARRLGLNPKPLLERIFISRAYTCHQLLEAITSMLAPLAERPEPPLAVILGLDRLFLDDDIPLGERRRLYSRVVARIKELLQRGLPLLTAVTHAECGVRNAEWRPFYAALQLRDADEVMPVSVLDQPQWGSRTTQVIEMAGAGGADEGVTSV